VAAERDRVDHLIEQWAHERPDLDMTPMGIIARMSRLSRYLERAVGDVLAAHGLNESQFGVLAALRRAGPPHTLSPTELYSSLLISSGAMTNRLERLTALGYIRRVPKPSDRRSSLVALTAKGLRVVDRAVEAHAANERRLLSSLMEVEKRDLARLLRKMLLSFESDGSGADGDASRRPKGSRSRSGDATARSSHRRREGADR
jgi:DNA-binding MarR family transcriptional regulator